MESKKEIREKLFDEIKGYQTDLQFFAGIVQNPDLKIPKEDKGSDI